jgi:hypothetical protein
MRRALRIRPWVLDEDPRRQYDLFVSTLGYERRARYIAENVPWQAKSRVAVGFSRKRQFAYRENEAWYNKAGFGIIHTGDSGLTAVLDEAVSRLRVSDDDVLRICVDISSMTRLRIAFILDYFASAKPGPGYVIDVLYAPARYKTPTRVMSQIESAGPILPSLAGWPIEPERPLAAIFGLGYEFDRAVGALEYIEPHEVWGFHAIAQDKRFEHDVMAANRFFWQFLPQERRLGYAIERPLDCLMSIESLTYGLLRYARPVLVPFGPKVFTVCCLLTAFMHHPYVAVWRVTSGEHELAIDRIADGNVIGLRVHLGSNR